MNEKFDAEFEDREIKMLYKENAQRTAPDMEKLWSRIESAIDGTQETDNRREQITVQTTKRNSAGRLIAWAAAFLLIAGGAFAAIRAAESSKLNTAESSSDLYAKGTSKSAQTDGTAKTDNKTARVDNIAPAADNEDTQSKDTLAEAEDTEKRGPEKSADAAEEQPSAETNNIDGTRTNDAGGAAQADQTRAPAGSVDYGSLALGHEGVETAAYVPAAGEFNEADVLSRTEMFLDVRVIAAEKQDTCCTYTLDIADCYAKDGKTLTGTVSLDSACPVLLSAGGEYLLPVTEDEEGLHILCESIPQIEITLDGYAVFYSGWTTLAEGAEDCSYPVSEFQRMMCLGSADRINALLESWSSM